MFRFSVSRAKQESAQSFKSENGRATRRQLSISPPWRWTWKSTSKESASASRRAAIKMNDLSTLSTPRDIEPFFAANRAKVTGEAGRLGKVNRCMSTHQDVRLAREEAKRRKAAAECER